VSCFFVSSAPGSAVMTIDGLAPDTEVCSMPSVYDITIPLIT
jgi:hypothetical protein